LQTPVIAPDEDFVQIGGGMKKVYSDKARLEMNLAMEFFAGIQSCI
jgi:hypothetical protein